MSAVRERFWSKVEKTDGCWLWRGYVNPAGYGRFGFDRRSVQAHRFAYEDQVGPIPEGLTIDHLCRVRNCVNPTHLEPVTNRENLLRGETIVAAQVAKTHCPYGHEYTPENTRVSRRGRECRKCRNRRKRKYYQQHVERLRAYQRGYNRERRGSRLHHPVEERNDKP